jgi:cell wall-associated NlpC family hydrolase
MGFRQARYRFGAASPHATDCSGMTMQLYRTVGIKLPHSARAQYHYGKAVAKKDLLPGDLCFFNTRGGISHVGMYIGDGKMIHAANPRKGVRIDPLSTSYYARRFVGARRLLPEGAPMPVLPPVTDTTPGIEIPEGEMLATATGSARVLGN